MYVYAAEEFCPNGKTILRVFDDEAGARKFCADCALLGNSAIWWHLGSTAKGNNGL